MDIIALTEASQKKNNENFKSNIDIEGYETYYVHPLIQAKEVLQYM